MTSNNHQVLDAMFSHFLSRRMRPPRSPGTSLPPLNPQLTESSSVRKPFHCERCTSCFRQRSQLARHFLRVHEKRRNFACCHCDKKFASAFDRKRHVEAVHARRGNEWYCDRCKFKTKTEEDLSQHVKQVHERDRCFVCGRVFKRTANLVAHERHYHHAV